MSIYDFIEGMMVVVSNRGADDVNMVGHVGEVIGFEPARSLVCVKFSQVPDELKDELHTCKGRCEYGHGWNFSPDCIAPVEGGGEEFDAADEGDICDFTGEPAELKVGNLHFKKIFSSLVKRCEICGEYHYASDFHRDDEGHKYCISCVEERGWMICADCGKILRPEDAITINDGFSDERVVCMECSENGSYVTCDDCGKFFFGSHITFSSRGIHICASCSDNWATCYDCGSLVRRTDENFYGGSYYCDRHNPFNIPIHNYGFKPNPTFYGDGDLFMGVELEIDRGEDPDGVAESIKRPQIYCKHDGSLAENGVEIVSHPCTLEYHTNELGWGGIIENARRFDYESHNAGTCGLHVHVNKTFFGDTTDEQELNISKVIMLVQRFWEEVVAFSRRRRGDINHWAKKPYVEFCKGDSAQDACRKVRQEANDCDRYRAVNLQNSATIEFRMYRGTLKLNTLLATLQFTDGLCRFAKEHSIDDVYDVSWDEFINDDVFDYDELRNYLPERSL